ncbi:unnamed protein product [Linum tenue]|uniref:RNase H type-1 domain-containing protein n=1 Tax=Linum tenue TaxID=586396 RepID=A0AAV0MT72_9ROSI|nr:unnamed protein product [Linum tenue]
MEGKKFSAQGLMCRINAWFSIIRNAPQFVKSASLKAMRDIRTRDIAWKPPPAGWIQLQSDGSVHSGTGKAAAGGLLRDHLADAAVIWEAARLPVLN